MNRTLSCVAVVLLASSALAQPDEPHMPEDPPVVVEAQSWLGFFWRECRREAYPADPEAGVDKVSSVVTFKVVQGRHQASLELGLHGPDAEPLAMSNVQSVFVACVKHRFEAHRLGRWAREDLAGRRIALTTPFCGASVVERGELGRQRAVEVIAHHLDQARAHCGTAPGRVTVAVDITPEGQPAAVSTSGAAATKTCLEKRLMKTLRFPAVASPSRIEVPVPPEH